MLCESFPADGGRFRGRGGGVLVTGRGSAERRSEIGKEHDFREMSQESFNICREEEAKLSLCALYMVNCK